jgi:hypothetical protein
MKYPNPFNPAVVAMDTVDRSVENGVLKTHRLVTTEWSLPDWAIRILGADRACFASEHSEVDPVKKTLTMQSRNITFCNELSIEEKLTYAPHPNIPGATLLNQESIVTVHGIPLSSYFESFITRAISVNAAKGRQAMEYVVGKINSEVQELTTKTVKSVDELAARTKRCLPEDLKTPHSQYHYQGPKS